MATIDIGEAGIITVTASVLETTQQALSQNGLFFSESERLPTDTITSFSSDTAVGNFFGTSSDEYTAATLYFKGFDGSFKKPTEIIFYRKVSTAAGAWLLGGSMTSVTLADVQAITAGTFTITIDAETFTTTAIDLSGATSFTNAAALLQVDLRVNFVADVVVEYDVTASAFRVSSATTGSNSVITFATGTVANILKLQSTKGGFLSQGAAITTYSDSIDNVWNANTKDFVSVTTIEVLADAEFLELAGWIANKNDCAVLFVHTTDAAAVDSQSVTDVNSVLADAGYNCARGVYGTFESAAAQCGFVACLDFDRESGWGTVAFKQQSGLPTIEMTTADCIAAKAKGYIFFSTFSTRASRENFDYLGSFGDWAYPDVLVGKIVIEDRCQITIENVLLSSSIENDEDGRAIIRSALSDSVFEVGKLAKAISKGEPLSQAQRDKVNQLLNDPQGYQNIEANGYHIKMTPKVPGSTTRHVDGIAVYQAGGFIHSVALTIKVQVN